MDARPRSLAINLDRKRLENRSRYKADFETTALQIAVDGLAAAGLITHKPGHRERYLSANERKTLGDAAHWDAAPTLRPTERLTKKVARERWSITHLAYTGDAEAIILNSRKAHPRDDAIRLEYDDTDHRLIPRWRAEMKEINDWIARFDLAQLDGAGTLIPLDASQKFLRRIFSGGFEANGRLYGGAWENMPGVERWRLRLQGEEIAILDYGQMFLRLLYAQRRMTPPPGDLYDVSGLKGHREGVKKLINALLHRDKLPVRYPTDEDVDGGSLENLFPQGMSVDAAVAAIREKHPKIATEFGTKKGYSLAFRESEILIATLRACKEADLSALPLHDALIAPVSRAEDAAKIMREVFVKRTKAKASISMTRPQWWNGVLGFEWSWSLDDAPPRKPKAERLNAVPVGRITNDPWCANFNPRLLAPARKLSKRAHQTTKQRVMPEHFKEVALSEALRWGMREGENKWADEAGFPLRRACLFLSACWANDWIATRKQPRGTYTEYMREGLEWLAREVDRGRQ